MRLSSAGTVAEMGPAQKLAALCEQFRHLSAKELDDWYQQHVGRRILEEEPEVAGTPDHWKQCAEMSYLHTYGEDGDYALFRQALIMFPE